MNQTAGYFLDELMSLMIRPRSILGSTPGDKNSPHVVPHGYPSKHVRVMAIIFHEQADDAVALQIANLQILFGARVVKICDFGKVLSLDSAKQAIMLAPVFS